MLASVSASCVFSSRRSSSETTRSSSATPSRCHPTLRAEGPAHQPKHPQSPRRQKVIFCVQGVTSVLLSNVYLHYVLDLWFERVVKPRLRGEAYLVRYIDEFVLCFQYRADALRVQKALCQRLGKFGLTLESSKTKLVEFGRFAQRHASKRDRKRPETIYFLGFTLYCTRNRRG